MTDFIYTCMLVVLFIGFLVGVIGFSYLVFNLMCDDYKERNGIQ